MDAVKDAVGTVLFGIFFGFFSGAAIAVSPAAIALLCHGPSEYGTRLGVYFLFAGVIGLFGASSSSVSHLC